MTVRIIMTSTRDADVSAKACAGHSSFVLASWRAPRVSFTTGPRNLTGVAAGDMMWVLESEICCACMVIRGGVEIASTVVSARGKPGNAINRALSATSRIFWSLTACTNA